MSSLVKISEAASLGLHAMLVLAQNLARRYSSAELSKTLKVSFGHLRIVLMDLAKVGLVNAVRGPHGGFVLGRPADEISLLDIYQAIEGPVEPATCLLSEPVCKNGKCVFGDLIQNINQQVAEHLARTKLSSQQ
jgi:Rrf2 family protein